MSRTPRFRSRDHTHVGTWVQDWELISHHSSTDQVRSALDTCNDSIGRPIANSPFASVQYSTDCMKASGIYRPQQWYDILRVRNTLDEYPVLPVTSLDTTPLAPPDGWFLDVIAGTNPSRPVLNPPELLQDLIDIPKQLLDAGNFLSRQYIVPTSKDVANQFLGVKFGWLPLIEDLKQLMELQSYILKRSKELNQLYSGKGLRRRLRFGENNAVEGTTTVLPGSLGSSFIEVSYCTSVKKHSWATIRWKPTSPPPYSTADHAQHDFVRKLVLGLTVEGMTKGTWNIIPWTWLLGWFTNIGKYALAHSNTVPAEHSGACFMSESVRTSTATQMVQHEIHDCSIVFEGTDKLTQKQRFVSDLVGPGFNMPFMDISRLSVLSALAVQRLMR